MVIPQHNNSSKSHNVIRDGIAVAHRVPSQQIYVLAEGTFDIYGRSTLEALQRLHSQQHHRLRFLGTEADVRYITDSIGIGME